MAHHIRVLLQDVPAMLGAIVRAALADHPDIELMTEAPGGNDPEQWRRRGPDVVVVSTPSVQKLTNVGEYLNRWPRARIVVIEVSGRDSTMYELRPRATSLGALSPDQLVRVIRHSPDE